MVPYLVEHYADRLRQVHEEDPPGAARCDESLQMHISIPEQMKVKGRTRTYLSLVANLGRIYKLWKRRNESVDMRDFRRGLAHLLLLSSPGSGAIACLAMLLLKAPELPELLDTQRHLYVCPLLLELLASCSPCCVPLRTFVRF